MDMILKRGLSSMAAVAAALGLAGCGGGGGGGTVVPTGNTIAAVTSVKVNTDYTYTNGKNEQTESAETEVKTDNDGKLTSVIVKHAGQTYTYDQNCWGDIRYGECLDGDDNTAIVSNYGKYSYLKVVAWESFKEDPNDGSVSVLVGEGITGDKTPVDAMPKNRTATYEGDVILKALPESGQVTWSTVDQVVRFGIGDARYAVDFNSGSVEGTFGNFRDLDGRAVSGEVRISGQVSGNAFSVNSVRGGYSDVNITSGNGKGYFYGPDARELGGVATFAGTCDGGKNCTGSAVFVGRQR